MCGIFGFFSKVDSGLNKDFARDIFKKLFLLSESRGKEASGFAAIFNDEIVVCKSPFSASEFVKSNVFRDFFAKFPEQDLAYLTAFGHTRLVTDGGEHENRNNQPVHKNGFCVVHNGIIVNQKELWGKYSDEKRNTELDSELIPTLLARFVKEDFSPLDAIRKLYENIYGMTTIAIYFEKFDNLVLATNNGSLYYLFNNMRDAIIFASEKYILRRLVKSDRKKLQDFDIENVTQLKPRTTLSLKFHDGSFAIADLEKSQKGIYNFLISRDKKRKIVEISEHFGKIAENKSLKPVSFSVPKRFESAFVERTNRISSLKRCVKCILPETFPFIEFDEKGVCNYCRNYKKIKYKGEKAFGEVVKPYRKNNDEPECLIPFSGGRDSSYVLHYVKNVLDLKPLAFSYDWGMITDLARRNQSRLCGKLGVEHILISADIRKKRANIKKNVLAWLKRPNLGTVPLFMAGDKQYFYFANLLMEHNNIKISILGENLLETTKFKSGFCGIKPSFGDTHTYTLTLKDKVRLLYFYGKEYILNPSYLNASLIDTLDAFRSYYIISHRNINLYNYIEWNEEKIINTLIKEYDWETDPGTKVTWRIGDGTAAFYNYIYYMLAGFTENDTFRSNQIREGILTREKALELVMEENLPRWDSLKWYCNTIDVDFEDVIERINNFRSLF